MLHDIIDFCRELLLFLREKKKLWLIPLILLLLLAGALIVLGHGAFLLPTIYTLF